MIYILFEKKLKLLHVANKLDQLPYVGCSFDVA